MSTTAEQKASEGTADDARSEPNAPRDDGNGADGESGAGARADAGDTLAGAGDTLADGRRTDDADTQVEPETAGGAEPEGNGEWAAGGLSAEEAERLAADFKAPWEDVEEQAGWAAGAPGSTPAAPASTPSTPGSAASSGATARHDDEDAETVRQPPSAKPAAAAASAPSSDVAEPIPTVPTLKPDRKVWVVAGAVGVAVVVGLVVALSAGDDDATEPIAEAAAGPADEAASADSQSSSDEGGADSRGEDDEAEAAAEDGEPSETAGATAETETDGETESDGAEQAAEPATVQVTLRTEPADATLVVDGTRVANPYDVELEQSDAEHRVLARKSGYEPAEATLSFDEDVSETLELERKSEPRAERPTASRQRHRQPRGRGSGASKRRGSRSSGASSSPSSSSDRSAGFVTDNPY